MYINDDKDYIVQNTIFWSYARWWTTLIIGTGSFAPRPMFFCLAYFIFGEIHANRYKYLRQLLFSEYNKGNKVKTDLNLDRKYLNSDGDITSIVSNFFQLSRLVKIYFVFVCATYLFALPFAIFTFLVPLSLFIIFVILHGVYFCVREPHDVNRFVFPIQVIVCLIYLLKKKVKYLLVDGLHVVMCVIMKQKMDLV